MAIHKYKPTTAGRRGASVARHDHVTKLRPMKRFLRRKLRTGGRNNQGKITVRHHGGGAKRLYRVIDFHFSKPNVPANVKYILYDPNRNAHIAHIVYRDGEHAYILAAEGMRSGDVIMNSSDRSNIRSGNRMALEHVPSGMPIYNIELHPGQGGKLVRSAGSQAFVMAVEGDFAQVKMPSGEIRMLPKSCQASIGQVSNPEFRNIRLGKAGRMRYRGVRPTVRGKAMNPVDHAHGGGEGKHPIGLKHPKTPWGKPALGVPTRRNKPSHRLILKRRGKKGR